MSDKPAGLKSQMQLAMEQWGEQWEIHLKAERLSQALCTILDQRDRMSRILRAIVNGRPSETEVWYCPACGGHHWAEGGYNHETDCAIMSVLRDAEAQ